MAKQKIAFCFIFFALCIGRVVSQNAGLTIEDKDIWLEPEFAGRGTPSARVTGYHLFIRKKPGMESVLLTEPKREYALRAPKWNAVNGNEIRYLNGKVLDSKYARYSIVDSSAEEIKGRGAAFYLYLPMDMAFGYLWARQGTVRISAGTVVNIRVFNAKYADYSGGSYQDNQFTFTSWFESDGYMPPVAAIPDENTLHPESMIASPFQAGGNIEVLTLIHGTNELVGGTK
jgi:hypothetical protein